MQSAEDSTNKARGFKATLANPNVSEEAKQNAQRELDENYNGGDYSIQPGDEGKNPGNVIGGLKAAINNPQVTNEGKQAAQQKLDSLQS